MLRIWRLQDGALGQAALEGLTNHRFVAPDISGGVRDCGEGPLIVFADASWRWITAVRLAEGALSARAFGPLDDAGLGLALGCVY